MHVANVIQHHSALPETGQPQDSYFELLMLAAIHNTLGTAGLPIRRRGPRCRAGGAHTSACRGTRVSSEASQRSDPGCLTEPGNADIHKLWSILTKNIP